jgi:hypothetical protein
MTVERFHLLHNVGQFDSEDAGAQIALTPSSLKYAEDGLGKKCWQNSRSAKCF